MPKPSTTEQARPVHADHIVDAGPREDRSSESPATRGARRRIVRVVVRVLAGVLALLVLGAVVAPYVYIHFIEGDPPKPLTFETTNSTPTRSSNAKTGSTTARTASAAVGVAGAWTVADGSTVGYRVNEMLFGQKNTAVGRTTAVSGHLSIDNTTVRSADFSVDVSAIRSDDMNRDGSLVQTMATATFPTANFTLTTPIALATIPADLRRITVPVTGNLTLHGVTKPVTFQLAARRNGSAIEVNGSIPIAFSEYGITTPSRPGINVANNGQLEFLLAFGRRTAPRSSVTSAPTDSNPSR